MAFALAAALSATGCFSGGRKSSAPPGDWREETGVSAVPDTNPRSEARAKAVSQAEEDARRKIRALFTETTDSTGRTVWQAMEAKPYVWARVMSLLHETRSHEQTDLEGGMVQVRLRVDMNTIRRICESGEAAEVDSPLSTVSPSVIADRDVPRARTPKTRQIRSRQGY